MLVNVPEVDGAFEQFKAVIIHNDKLIGAGSLVRLRWGDRIVTTEWTNTPGLSLENGQQVGVMSCRVTTSETLDGKPLEFASITEAPRGACNCCGKVDGGRLVMTVADNYDGQQHEQTTVLQHRPGSLWSWGVKCAIMATHLQVGSAFDIQECLPWSIQRTGPMLSNGYERWQGVVRYAPPLEAQQGPMEVVCVELQKVVAPGAIAMMRREYMTPEGVLVRREYHCPGTKLAEHWEPTEFAKPEAMQT